MNNWPPKCDECGKFIPWENSYVERVPVQDMDGSYSEDDRIGGLCNEHKAPEAIPTGAHTDRPAQEMDAV